MLKIAITELNARHALLNLDIKKVHGHDGVSPRMLRRTVHSIAPSLTKLSINHYNWAHIQHIGKR